MHTVLIDAQNYYSIYKFICAKFSQNKFAFNFVLFQNLVLIKIQGNRKYQIVYTVKGFNPKIM